MRSKVASTVCSSSDEVSAAGTSRPDAEPVFTEGEPIETDDEGIGS